MTESLIDNQKSGNQSSETEIVTPTPNRFLKLPKCIEYDVPAATGILLDSMPRGALIIANIFLLSLLIDLAKEAAGCPTEDREADEWIQCTKTIYGFKPTSLATGMASTGSFIIAFLLPIIGATIDHTNYRWAIGMWTAVILFVVNLFQCFVSLNLWIAVAVTQIVQAIIYMVHLVPAFAYIPELTNETSKMGRYNASFNIAQYAFMLIQLIFVACLVLAKVKSILLVRYSQLLVTTWIGVFMGFAWAYRFDHVEAKTKLAEGASLLTIGFIRSWKSLVFAAKNHRHIMWFYFAIAFADAAVINLQVIVITFSKWLAMDDIELAVFQIIVIVCSFPGSKLIVLVIDKCNPKRALQYVFILWFVTLLLCGIVIKGPESKLYFFFLAILVGLGFGSHYVAMRTTFTEMVPKGQEAEFMGMYLLSTQCLIWLPSLIFTIMNENDIPMNYSVITLGGFILVGYLFLTLMGPLENAQKRKAAWDDETSTTVA